MGWGGVGWGDTEESPINDLRFAQRKCTVRWRCTTITLPSIIPQGGPGEGGVSAVLPLPWEVERSILLDPPLKVKHIKNRVCKTNKVVKKFIMKTIDKGTVAITNSMITEAKETIKQKNKIAEE